MNDIVIRPLSARDFDHGFPDVLQVLAPVHLDRDSALHLYATHLYHAGSSCVFVALDGARVVGCATLLVEQKFIHGGGQVAHVEDVAVDPHYQGQGVGCALVGRCMDTAREIGCYKVILDCADSVVGFYERLGFRRHENHMRYDIEGVHGVPTRPGARA